MKTHHVYLIPKWAEIVEASGGPRQIPLKDNETNLKTAKCRLNTAILACAQAKVDADERVKK